jgi:hypothetical protein
MFAFLLLLLPLSAPVNHVDVIELNHFYDCQTGQEVFKQWLFWDLKDGEWELVDWRLCQKSDIVFGNVLTTCGKTIKAELVSETWTDFDRELAAREKTPKERRKGIR